MKQTICHEIKDLIKVKLDEGLSVTALSKMFHLSRTTIYSIKNGKELRKRGRKSISENKRFIQTVKRSIRKIKKTKKEFQQSKFIKICQMLHPYPPFKDALDIPMISFGHPRKEKLN